MDDEETDILGALIAEIDQALAMAPNLARYARGLYDCFKEVGFTDEQALTLTQNRLNNT